MHPIRYLCWAWLIHHGGVHSFQGWNCSSDAAKTTVISLVDPGECLTPQSNYRPSVNKTVQVLYEAGSKAVPVHRCKVVETRYVASCGFNSFSYGRKTVSFLSTLPIPPEDCTRASLTGILDVDGRRYYSKQLNEDTNEEEGEHVTFQLDDEDQFYAKGGLDDSFNCRTSDFTLGGVAYADAYLEIVRQIKVRQEIAILDREEGVLKFPDGLTVDASQGFAHDAELGTLTWTPTPEDCHNTYTEVYYGDASVRTRIPQAGEVHAGGTLLNGSLVLAHRGRNQAMGFRTDKPIRQCGRQCYRTQLPGFSLCFLAPLAEAIPLDKIEADTTLQLVDLRAQMAFLHLSMRGTLADAFSSLAGEICHSSQEMLRNRFAMTAFGNPYALNPSFGPGHFVSVAGAAAYVTKCAPVELVTRATDSCYQEVPVETEDGAWKGFANAINFLTQDHGSPTPCSDIAPMRYHLAGEWYCASPTVVKCQAAAQLPPRQTQPKPQDFTIGIDGGVFSPDQVRDYRDALKFHGSRQAVGPNLAWEAIGDQDEGTIRKPGTLGLPFNVDDLRKPAIDLIESQFPTLGYLTVITAIVAALVVFCAFKQIILGICKQYLLPAELNLAEKVVHTASSTAGKWFTERRRHQAQKKGRKAEERKRIEAPPSIEVPMAAEDLPPPFAAHQGAGGSVYPAAQLEAGLLTTADPRNF